MKYKHIEAAREARLWVGQIIVPAVMLGATLYNIPSVRSKVENGVDKIKSKFSKYPKEVKR